MHIWEEILPHFVIWNQHLLHSSVPKANTVLSASSLPPRADRCQNASYHSDMICLSTRSLLFGHLTTRSSCSTILHRLYGNKQNICIISANYISDYLYRKVLVHSDDQSLARTEHVFQSAKERRKTIYQNKIKDKRKLDVYWDIELRYYVYLHWFVMVNSYNQ